jgi:predicted lipid-binding transport protein (Tim44 family)
MRKYLFAAAMLFVGGALVVQDVEARRLGGARSIGAQRNIQSPPPARPAQQQAAQPSQAAPAQGAPAAAKGSKWGPILGGLALGGLLGYLFAGNGLGGVLLLGLLAIAAVLAFRALARRREAPRQVQYEGLGKDTVYMPRETQAPPPAAGAAQIRIPGFDAEAFLRAARTNFARLQVANDMGRLEEIRDFTTDEMYEEVRRDFSGRGAPQQTDIASLDAELLELATEGDKHWASVRFSGTVRETPGAAPAAFQEVWNLVKPADGSSGWLLAGIQQMH